MSKSLITILNWLECDISCKICQYGTSFRHSLFELLFCDNIHIGTAILFCIVFEEIDVRGEKRSVSDNRGAGGHS